MLTDQYAAWVETPSIDLNFNDWVMLSYDRGRGLTHVLAFAEKLPAGARLPRGPGDTVPTIGGNMVYWATPYRRGYTVVDAREFGVRIERRRLDGVGGISVVAERAKLPAAQGPDLYYVRSEDVAPGYPKGRYEVRRWRAGQEEIIVSGAMPGQAQVAALAAGPGSIAWIVSGSGFDQPGRIYVLNVTTGHATEISLNTNGRGSVLSYTQDRVVWGNGSGSDDPGEYAFDPTSAEIYKLGEQDGFSSVVGSPLSAYVLVARLMGNVAVYDKFRWLS